MTGQPWHSELREIEWATLGVAYGNAAEIPETLIRLTSEEVDERTEAYEQIRDFLVSEGMRFEAASYVIPFLIRLVGEGLTLHVASVLELLAELAFREEVDYIVDGVLLHRTHMEIPSELEESMYDAEEKSLSIDLYYKIMAGIPVYCRYLQSGNVSERVQAAALLGYFPEEAARVKPYFLEILTSSAPVELVATVQIAAGFIGLSATDQEVKSALIDRLRHEDGLVRWSAAIGLAWPAGTSHGLTIDLLGECKNLAKEYSTNIPYLHGNIWILADLALRRCVDQA